MKVSSLHIPINTEALHEYQDWVKGDCNYLWWYKKEQRKKERLEIPTALTERLSQEFK